eukprot:12077468-Ditylum_brightwellii.AAC.1
MAFNIFMHYLTTQKNSKGKLLSQTAYISVHSSLCHLYRMTGQDMGPESKKNTGHFLSGMKQTVVKAKAKSGESLDEGKKYMTYDAYSKLCEILFAGE